MIDAHIVLEDYSKDIISSKKTLPTIFSMKETAT